MEVKKREIYLPTNYISVCRNSRSANPNNIRYLDYTCLMIIHQ